VCAHRADRPDHLLGVPAIVVYAQDLLPAAPAWSRDVLRTGVRHGQRRSGGARKLADHSGIDFVYQVCAFLPLIGLLAAFLPDVHEQHVPRAVDMLAA